MEIRKFDPELDYKAVCGWWERHDWPCIPLELLPETALIVEGVCAGWLYKTDSKIAWIEWVVSNPDIEHGERGRGLDILMSGLIERARSLGFGSVFSSLSNQRLIARYKAHGFIETETGMSNMIMRLS